MLTEIKISSYISKRVAVLLAGTAILFSCSSDMETIPGLDVNRTPGVIVRKFESVSTDGGELQLIMKSPLMYSYTRVSEPYNEFPEGIEVYFYDNHKEPTASVTAKYARYYVKKKMWELRYDVKARNEKRELLETELLYWEEESGVVRTDLFIRISGEDRIISGTGFESDARFDNWEIRNGNAIIYLRDE